MAIDSYDVIIVGAGPAGIFAALELSRNGIERIAILDKGSTIAQRRCPARERAGRCLHCTPCALVAGWGGAGAFSDGKLTLSPQVGGHLADMLGADTTQALIDEVDDTYVHFGATGPVYGKINDDIERLKQQAALAELKLLTVPIRHMGTERSGDILSAMYAQLAQRGVQILMNTGVAQITTENGRVSGVLTHDRQRLQSRYVIVAPGREGAAWLTDLARTLRIPVQPNPVDIGVRVELPASIMEPLTKLVYEPKLHYYSRSFDDKVRTFCVCPYGEVVTEYAGDVVTVNGHSYADQRTENTNFAILVSKHFTEPFREPIAYGKYIAHLANLLSGGVMVQRLGDLKQGRRTTEQRLSRCITRPTLKSATPGDLGLVLPYRYIVNIMEIFEAMDKLAPGVDSRHTLLYGVEVKYYSSRLELSTQLETPVHNLFAAGDGAGITRGLVQASASGLIAAREILSRQ